MLPHRIGCHDGRKNEREKKECAQRSAHVSDSRMKLLNSIYKAVASAKAVHLIDVYKITFGDAANAFGWKRSWMLNRESARKIWNYILGSMVSGRS